VHATETPSSGVSPETDHTMDRVDKALALIDPNGRGLEIGPSHNPLAPKRNGYLVHVVDHLPTDELRVKMKNEGLSTDLIEEVDYVWAGGQLDTTIDRPQYYDWIIASHVIEHLPDLVSFLISSEHLLQSSGILSLIIPDKRNCFDHFRPLSTTGQMLDAYLQKRDRPSPGGIFDHVSHAVQRGGDIAWTEEDNREFRIVHGPEEIRAHYNRAVDLGEYLDAHVWTFTPSSFRLLITDLRMLGLTQLSIVREFDTTGHEFHVSLAISSVPDPPSTRGAAVMDVAEDWRETPQATPSEDVVDRTSLMRVSQKERTLLLTKRRGLHRARKLRQTAVERVSRMRHHAQG
jgi:hypothetical protein